MEKEALQKMTVAELKGLAKKIPGVKGVSAMKKDDLVELLAKQPREVKPAAAEHKMEKATVPMDRSGIKQRIRELKEEKRQALAQDDRAKAKECNRRIHRYKRQLRKMIREEQRKKQ